MQKFESGTSWVFSVQPGWIVTGEITSIEEDHVVLRNAAWIENVAAGCSALGSIALAQTPGAVAKTVTTTWPLPDGTRLNRAAINIATPASTELRVLTRSDTARVISEA